MEIKINLEKAGIPKKDIMKYKEQVENIHKDLNRMLVTERKIRTSNIFVVSRFNLR